MPTLQRAATSHILAAMRRSTPSASPVAAPAGGLDVAGEGVAGHDIDRRRVATALAELAAEAPLEVVARGGSMGPALADGARLEVRAARRYLPGDVVVFVNGAGDRVVHRLLGALPGRGGWRYVTRGDAAARADGLVPRARLIGRVTGGEVAAELIRVPLAARLAALGRFALYLGGRLLERVRR